MTNFVFTDAEGGTKYLPRSKGGFELPSWGDVQYRLADDLHLEISCYLRAEDIDVLIAFLESAKKEITK